jgi:hypothetical protein
LHFVRCGILENNVMKLHTKTSLIYNTISVKANSSALLLMKYDCQSTKRYDHNSRVIGGGGDNELDGDTR